MSWPLVCIGDCVEKVASWNPLKSESQTPFFYIDLSSVDKDKKAVDRNGVSKVLPNDAPSRARQIVKSGDVLVATVRPNLNGVALVPEEYEGATASTGYCVLRSEGNRLDSKYLYYWVQTRVFVTDMMEKATGANYPAVSDKIIKESKIPLPPLTEQKRIAAILDKADAIRRKCQQAIQLADEFLRAVFLDMFGDPVTNPKGWDKGHFGDVINVLTDYHANGSYKTLNENVTLLEEPSYAYMVRTTDLESKNYTDGVKYIDEHAYNYLHKTKLYGDEIIINKIGSAGAVYLMPELGRPVSLAMNQFMIRCSDYNLTEFFYHQLLTKACKREISKRVQGAVTKTITKDAVRNIPVIIPPYELQRSFVKIAKKYKSSFYIGLKRGDIKKDHLFGSLSQKAFSGEL
ncbi:restriction endonuclease subunit S [Xenorhabdus bovienii]|uniref:restriction endonuclease subunit S n=1 Tax=Xenorhabdus bovienii TaxID=40576 RepID=UPI0004D7C13D|nr:restriction endonuclease subunit S [Xenorhabdus bovienii]CDG86797.1 Type I restriction modification DNA specificity domain protein [Xenorhabdus bovienii str. feltiae France]CDG92020.1 Type I restriction modification DNA specificity domain protein [Xenorhabdus bovienii str. feltiae Florida]